MIRLRLRQEHSRRAATGAAEHGWHVGSSAARSHAAHPTPAALHCAARRSRCNCRSPWPRIALVRLDGRERPLVCILTDGSGSTGTSRIGYSAALLDACDAVPGSIMGMLPDRAWYAAILALDAEPFLAAADAIGQATEQGALVVADPVEGYNPMHDLCAALADRVAAGIAGRRATYPLMTASGKGEPLPLDTATEGRKRAAVSTYAPLAEEAAALLRTNPHALLDERIMPAGFTWPPTMQPPPAYERIGAARTAAGIYGRTIGYAAHVRPLALRLRATPGMKTAAGPQFGSGPSAPPSGHPDGGA